MKHPIEIYLNKVKIPAIVLTATLLTGCAAHLAKPSSLAADKSPATASADRLKRAAAAHPVYVSKMPITKYTLFATGGWDGNWYVGKNQAWIEKINLERYKKSDYARAYIGAKLGRMKSQNVPGKSSWTREAYPGEIYAASASTPVWRPADYIMLTKTSDIPLQYDYENAIETVGEGRWFWAQFPLEKLNFDGDNYIVLWSPNEYFDSVSSAPILAAAWGDKGVDSWINTSMGAWPHFSSEDPLKTPISVFEPAIAVKLVPRAEAPEEIKVEIVSIEETPDAAGGFLKKITAAASGSQTEKAWLEISGDSKNWRKISRFVYEPPYVFVFEPVAAMSSGKINMRVAAQDIRGDIGFSNPIAISVEKK
ncbi:MAG: hypothetical protein QME32_06775 [Endomicrobiia bacterium]|nr:hypothetical protein [Endomicrobiia bacterium]